MRYFDIINGMCLDYACRYIKNIFLQKFSVCVNSILVKEDKQFIQEENALDPGLCNKLPASSDKHPGCLHGLEAVFSQLLHQLDCGGRFMYCFSFFKCHYFKF